MHRRRIRSLKAIGLDYFNEGKKHHTSIKQGKIVHCSICQKDGRAIQDHDHISQTERGIICSRCNTGLGCFLDDPAIMERAIEYLKYWKLKDVFGIL